jgi:hypothetical protein
MIEIKLMGGDAQDYLDGIHENTSTITQLLQEINELKDKLRNVTSAEMSRSTTSAKILSDAKKFTDIKSERSKPNPFMAKEPKDIVETPTAETVEVKYKSRLSKQDKIDLHDYAMNKVRSNCRVDQFSMKRRLRAVTVETYIDRHSNGKYKVVPGSDIKKWDIWDNAVVDPEKLYIRKA